MDLDHWSVVWMVESSKLLNDNMFVSLFVGSPGYIFTDLPTSYKYCWLHQTINQTTVICFIEDSTAPPITIQPCITTLQLVLQHTSFHTVIKLLTYHLQVVVNRDSATIH